MSRDEEKRAIHISTLKQLNISETEMAFDPQSGDSFQLNDSAKFILILLQQGLTVEDIAQSLSKKFKLTYEQALTDVMEFQIQLGIMGLLV